jgi:hypothetical protein
MPNGSLQPRASDELGSQTLSAIEIAAERDGVCIATLRRAKFDTGVRRPKTENQVPGGGLCSGRSVPSGRRGKMLKYYLSILSTLSTLNEINDLSGNVAKSRALERRCDTIIVPNCKIKPESLSTLSKIRTTVGVSIHLPAPHQREAAVRPGIEPRVPCRRHKLAEGPSA